LHLSWFPVPNFSQNLLLPAQKAFLLHFSLSPSCILFQSPDICQLDSLLLFKKKFEIKVELPPKSCSIVSDCPGKLCEIKRIAWWRMKNFENFIDPECEGERNEGEV
jgi:hypothetical protein